MSKTKTPSPFRRRGIDTFEALRYAIDSTSICTPPPEGMYITIVIVIELNRMRSIMDGYPRTSTQMIVHVTNQIDSPINHALPIFCVADAIQLREKSLVIAF